MPLISQFKSIHGMLDELQILQEYGKQTYYWDWALYSLPDQAPDLYRSNINGVRYNVFNSTLFADTNGHLSRYDKAQLVPFVERFPFVEFLNKVDIFKWVDWGEVAGFGLGNKTSIKNPSDFISPGLVCYDSVFPSWNQAFVREGAQILTIITNDGWWGNSSGHIQHFTLGAEQLNFVVGWFEVLTTEHQE